MQLFMPAACDFSVGTLSVFNLFSHATGRAGSEMVLHTPGPINIVYFIYVRCTDCQSSVSRNSFFPSNFLLQSKTCSLKTLNYNFPTTPRQPFHSRPSILAYMGDIRVFSSLFMFIFLFSSLFLRRHTFGLLVSG